MEKRKGKFIVIEGVDGAGKGTVIKSLKEYFKKGFIFTREPGGTHVAEKIRTLSLDDLYSSGLNDKTQFSLMWAARADHVDKLIAPNLHKGNNVITDRFDLSTYAYNIYGQEGNSCLENLFWETRDVYLDQYVPDLYIFLDVDPEIGRERQKIANQENNHFDDKDSSFKERVRNGSLKFLENIDIGNVFIIDASQSPEDVFKEVLTHITEIID